MNVDIEHIAITLLGVPIALGDGIVERLDGVLRRRLSELKLGTAGSGVAQVDLAAADAPAHADAHAITEMIAARLVDWIAREHDAAAATTDTNADANRERL